MAHEIIGILELIMEGLEILKKTWHAIVNWFHRTNCRHSLLDGTSEEGDICLHKHHLKREHRGIKKIRETYRFPPVGELEKETIHGVFCYDHREDDRGGAVRITAGGVGAKFVEIYFESKVGRGIEFTITIVGK